MCAALAQLVEHRFCKPTVVGSSPMSSSIFYFKIGLGVVPEWLKGSDCKSDGSRLRWFESTPLHHFTMAFWYGIFKIKFGNITDNLLFAGVAQLVEHQPSKLGVESSNLFARSILMLTWLSGRALPW